MYAAMNQPILQNPEEQFIYHLLTHGGEFEQWRVGIVEDLDALKNSLEDHEKATSLVWHTKDAELIARAILAELIERGCKGEVGPRVKGPVFLYLYRFEP